MSTPESTAPGTDLAVVRRRTGPGTWDGVATLVYKQEGDAPFKDITRQVLFADGSMAAELRYFEMAPGGHSTLERHEHVHAVMIHRGRGRCLVGDSVHGIAEGDLVFVPAMTWHQFKADADTAFGFLCMVNAARDKPMLPTAEESARLAADPSVAAFLAS